MKADFVARGAHVPTVFNSEGDTRARMFRAQRLWLSLRSLPAILAGDLNAKKPLDDSRKIHLLARHSVDHIYGNEHWDVLNRRVVELRKRQLSDHDAVVAVLRHRVTGEFLSVATVNLKHHWRYPAYRAAKIWELLNADVAICNEADDAQYRTFRRRSTRAYRSPSNSFPWVKGWNGNLIVWRTEHVTPIRRRSRPVFYIYLKGKKRQRRPRIPIPAVNWSPIVWFAFMPKKKG